MNVLTLQAFEVSALEEADSAVLKSDPPAFSE
jgi:hypothetical protein